MNNHYVVVTKREDYDPENGWFDNFDYDIECVGKCEGWIECFKEHKYIGIEANPDDGCPRCQYLDENEIKYGQSGFNEGHEPWCDEEEFEFHGELHTWRHSNGWTLPYPGCVVAGNDSLEIPSEIVDLNKAGRFEIDPVWYDEYLVELIFIREVLTTKKKIRDLKVGDKIIRKKDSNLQGVVQGIGISEDGMVAYFGVSDPEFPGWRLAANDEVEVEVTRTAWDRIEKPKGRFAEAKKTGGSLKGLTK